MKPKRAERDGQNPKPVDADFSPDVVRERPNLLLDLGCSAGQIPLLLKNLFRDELAKYRYLGLDVNYVEIDTFQSLLRLIHKGALAVEEDATQLTLNSRADMIWLANWFFRPNTTRRVLFFCK